MCSSDVPGLKKTQSWNKAAKLMKKLSCILQNECALNNCLSAKITWIQSACICSNQHGKLQSLVWSIVTSPLISLMGRELAYCWYCLVSWPIFLQFKLPNNLLALVSPPERHCKSSLLLNNTVQRPMNRPWIQTYMYWSRVYDINH